MPYIRDMDRPKLNALLRDVWEQIRWMEPDLNKRKGAVNYAISRIVLRSMRPDGEWSYHSISNAVSVLRDAATEIERRLMARREDKAIEENGDLPEYE